MVTTVVIFVVLVLFLAQTSSTPTPKSLSQAPAMSFLDNAWKEEAIHKLRTDREKQGHTPLVRWQHPALEHVDILWKNESASLTGSLKHRYAWALMMWALLEGHVRNDTHVFEASSGNTAASLAYMCRLVGVPFTAVVPNTLEAIKEAHIRHYGANLLKVDNSLRHKTARAEALKRGGFFMNQFGNAEKAEEFHESGNAPLESANIMHEILHQFVDFYDDDELFAPHYFVAAAGTGGTITSIGRYVDKYGLETDVLVADTQFSVYYDLVVHGRFEVHESGASLWRPPGMAGIGYAVFGPVVEGVTSSLNRRVLDGALKIPDLASTAAMAVMRQHGLEGGTSSGVNFVATLALAADDRKVVNRRRTQDDSRLVIATILADPSKYYESSYLNRTWIGENFAHVGGLPIYDCWIQVLEEVLSTGASPLVVGAERCAV